ncbi:hypothetical protein D3C84_1106980 [compost metagenome]
MVAPPKEITVRLSDWARAGALAANSMARPQAAWVHGCKDLNMETPSLLLWVVVSC